MVYANRCPARSNESPLGSYQGEPVIDWYGLRERNVVPPVRQLTRFAIERPCAAGTLRRNVRQGSVARLARISCIRRLSTGVQPCPQDEESKSSK